MKPCILLAVACSGMLHAQGPLTPPPGADPAIGPVNALNAGAPQATMKTLHQVEPRTPITSLPITLSAPGSYYFTGNLFFSDASGDAITITASDVTLDLMGFTLSSTSNVTGKGIIADFSAKRIRIFNGRVTGPTTVSGSPPNMTANLAGFHTGILSTSAQTRDFSVENLTVSGCRVYGLSVYNGSLRSCVAEQNGEGGIFVGSGCAFQCISSGNGENGFVASDAILSGCIAEFNGQVGISANSGTVTETIAENNGTWGVYASNGTVQRSTAKFNGGVGIEAPNGTVSNCSVRNNTSHGISADYGSITNCTAANNGGIGLNGFGATISHGTARFNGQHGVYAGNGSISFCVASANNTSATSPYTDIFPTSANASRTGNFPAP